MNFIRKHVKIIIVLAVTSSLFITVASLQMSTPTKTGKEFIENLSKPEVTEQLLQEVHISVTPTPTLEPTPTEQAQESIVLEPISAPLETPKDSEAVTSQQPVETDTEQPKSTENKEINEDDLYWLAVCINYEMGCSWIDDEIQRAVGTVVMNRVDSNLFPDTIYEVLFQKGQYSWSKKSSFSEPSEKCYANARAVLEGYRSFGPEVVFQAEFKQGSKVVKEYYDEILKTTTYFCAY